MRTALKQDLHPSHYATSSHRYPRRRRDDSVNARIGQLEALRTSSPRGGVAS